MKIIFGFNEVGVRLHKAEHKMNRKLLLLSNSTTYGTSYLSYAKDMIKAFLGKHEVSEILFVPYARCDYEDYTTTVREAVEPMGFSVKGIHTFPSPVEAVNKAQCIFIGGGNTFLLLKTLYENQLVEPIRKRVLEGNLVYIGSSAGTNVSTPSINTTNDMPIVYPPTFEALNLIPFNINPHYVDADPSSKHMSESREKRIQEYLEQGSGRKVLGIYEGVLIEVEGDRATLRGERGGKVFVKCKAEPDAIQGNSDISFLLKN
ncbi:alpha-aspartyl dipeptidase-like isoform X1 [Varroa destructor]|uniref:dipeptidase E n=2 Tax=Varroa destructor TaxID=109461 RepID=A0A7M7KQ11_VARDE|nr:alpha-aspartyl dipeptidase-like isoform X1 [Varroa destructor]